MPTKTTQTQIWPDNMVVTIKAKVNPKRHKNKNGSITGAYQKYELLLKLSNKGTKSFTLGELKAAWAKAPNLAAFSDKAVKEVGWCRDKGWLVTAIPGDVLARVDAEYEAEVAGRKAVAKAKAKAKAVAKAA